MLVIGLCVTASAAVTEADILDVLGNLEQMSGFLSRFLRPDFASVSYTHLDVYKRQVQRMAKALLPWIAALLIALAFITFIPEISLYIPRSMGLSIG